MRRLQKVGTTVGLAGIIIVISILAGGCTDGIWYIGNKAITKDPVTGEILTRKMNSDYERDISNLYDDNIRMRNYPYEGIDIPLFQFPLNNP